MPPPPPPTVSVLAAPHPQALSNTAWALAKLRVQPMRAWVETLILASFDQNLVSFGPQELSNMLWALAR